MRMLAVGCVLLVAPAAVGAQGTLTGVVREDSSRIGVAGIEIVVEALNKKAVTDSAGRFSLNGLEHGLHMVLVRAIGYRPLLLRAYLVSNDTLEVDLRIHRAVVELAPLEVTATAVPIGLYAFEQRRQFGFGKFIDWTVLRKSEHRRVSDIFQQIQGVRLQYDRFGRPFLTSSRSNCAMQVYLDGIPLYKPGRAGTPPPIDSWPVTELDAIEVYRGSAETPPEFSGAGSGCGTVLLWSRRS